jgi:hypothetical protein
MWHRNLDRVMLVTLRASSQEFRDSLRTQHVTTEQNGTRRVIDVAAASRLVAALEDDLERLAGSSQDVERLRSEVASLKAVLNSPVSESDSIEQGLHGVRDVFSQVSNELAADSVKAGRYVAEIGRILGL